MRDISPEYQSQNAEQAMAHLAEELAEALTAAAKSLRFGPYCVNPELPPADQETNIVWLRREMRDVVRAYLILGERLNGSDYRAELRGDILRECDWKAAE